MVLITRSRRRAAPPQRNERGAIVVITALLSVVLLGLSALAIDISNARQERRQAQGSADAAVLAAAQDLPDPNAAVETVKAYAFENFDTPISDWVGCSDPDTLSELPDSANSNSCISLDEPLSRIRVRLPNRGVDTAFGAVIGYDTIDVSADAVAEADLLRDDRIIPATVAASAGSGNICIENGGNDTDCASRTSGNFGSFDSRRTNIYLPTSSAQPNSLRINYSMGVDHILSIWGSDTTRVCDVEDKSPCSTTNVDSGEDANHLIPYTGNDVPPLTDGVIDNATISTDQGDTLFCGRLRRPDLTDANLTETAPENCDHWATDPGPGPSISILDQDLNGRHVSYWLKSEFTDLFFAGLDPSTHSTSPSSYWAAGDARLECFVRSYRFDYSGSLGHAAQSEFFIDPDQPIDDQGMGTEFTLAEATDYLKNTCGLDPSIVDTKMASLSDSADFWPMFDHDMVTDPRFGMIPVVGSWSSGGSTAMPIVRFWGTFMYRLYTSSTKLKAIDAWVFEPALIETDSGVADLQFGYQTDQPVIHLVG